MAHVDRKRRLEAYGARVRVVYLHFAGNNFACIELARSGWDVMEEDLPGDELYENRAY